MGDRNQRKWTIEDLGRLEAMSETHTRRQLAAEFGVSIKSIGCVMWRNGLIAGRRNGGDPPIEGDYQAMKRAADREGCDNLLQALIEHHGVRA